MEVETKKVIPMYVPKPNKSSPFLGHLALTKGGGFIRDRHAQTKGRGMSMHKPKAERPAVRLALTKGGGFMRGHAQTKGREASGRCPATSH